MCHQGAATAQRLCQIFELLRIFHRGPKPIPLEKQVYTSLLVVREGIHWTVHGIQLSCVSHLFVCLLNSSNYDNGSGALYRCKHFWLYDSRYAPHLALRVC